MIALEAAKHAAAVAEIVAERFGTSCVGFAVKYARTCKSNVCGFAGISKEPSVNPTAFQADVHCVPNRGFSTPTHAASNALPLLTAERNAAPFADLSAFAAFHTAFFPGTAGGTPPGPAGLPTNASKSTRIAASRFCFNFASTP